MKVVNHWESDYFLHNQHNIVAQFYYLPKYSLSYLNNKVVVLIFLLYIVWWKDFGIESSYRYALNLFLLLFYSLLININLLKKEI